MTQRCKACHHQSRGEIDVALARGCSAKAVARKFGVPSSSVQRHRRNGHIPPAVIDAFPRHAANLDEDALRQLRRDESAGILLNLARQRRILLGAQDRAEARRDKDWSLRCTHALHRNIELTARAVGEFAQHERAVNQVAYQTIMMTPDYLRLRAGLIAALRPYPAARKAVGEVLAQLEAQPVHFDGIRAGVDGVKQVEGWRDG
jgi:hypothetical protein